MRRIFRCFNLARFCRYGGTWTLLQSHISTLAKVLQFSQIGPIGLSVLGCQDGMQEMFHAAWDRNYETCTWLFGHNTIIKKPTASDGVIKKMGIYCRKQQFRCKNDDNHVKPRPWGHCSIMTKRCGVLCCLAADYLAGLSWDVFTIFYTKNMMETNNAPYPLVTSSSGPHLWSYMLDFECIYQIQQSSVVRPFESGGPVWVWEDAVPLHPIEAVVGTNIL